MYFSRNISLGIPEVGSNARTACLLTMHRPFDYIDKYFNKLKIELINLQQPMKQRPPPQEVPDKREHIAKSLLITVNTVNTHYNCVVRCTPPSTTKD